MKKKENANHKDGREKKTQKSIYKQYDKTQ